MSHPHPSHQAVQVAGSELWLLAERALWWPTGQVLMVADIHFGKAASYRALGQPVPGGTTAGNLKRLDALLAQLPCRRLIFLGDFLHSREARTARTLEALELWRDRHAALPITLVRGNHDKRAGDPPARWNIEVVGEPLLLGPFALQHEPAPHASHHVLAGHLHPAFVLRGRGRQQVRLPCFVIGEGLSLLPAFGNFTGAMTWKIDENERVFVVGDGGVWEVPSARRSK